MKSEGTRKRHCAVYTRKSSDEGLDQEFNSLDAQREACEAYIASQVGEGWRLVGTHYDDGGISGGTMNRPALRRLLEDIEARKIDTVVVYKVDRLTRSLADFAKIVEVFDSHDVSFVSVTQQFNTTNSMGRLTLNMLLSFAQFEREVSGERTRDKVAASKKKGMWMGGFVPLGYDNINRRLEINDAEADSVRTLFRLYLKHGNVRKVKTEADQLGLMTKIRQTGNSRMGGGRPLSRGHIYRILQNPIYLGRIAHKGNTYEGQHDAIINIGTWKAVQSKLATNAREHRSGKRVAEPSLLAGLLHDKRGNRLTPSHAVKNGKRYRYYVSPATLRGCDTDTGEILRIPAQEIEELVEGKIYAFLNNPAELIDGLGADLGIQEQHSMIASGQGRLKEQRKSTGTERRAFILQAVSSVKVADDSVEVLLKPQSLRQVLLGKEPSENRITYKETGAHIDDHNHGSRMILTVPAKLRLCSGEKRLVIPAGHSECIKRSPNDTLIKALVRAHCWKHKLFSGEAPSIRSIAKEERINESYVGRILRLAFLAPDITEAVLAGRQPADLELETLMKPIPLAWADQRRLFGFDPVI
jgi:site-specific DNA recombinase